MKSQKKKTLLLRKKTISNITIERVNGGKALPTTKQTSLEDTFCLCIG